MRGGPELYEETGYRCTSLKLDREGARNFFFLGERAALHLAFRPMEPISTLQVTLEAFKQMPVDGRFDHVVALATLLVAS